MDQGVRFLKGCPGGACNDKENIAKEESEALLPRCQYVIIEYHSEQ
jgi:hypothetical protein